MKNNTKVINPFKQNRLSSRKIISTALLLAAVLSCPLMSPQAFAQATKPTNSTAVSQPPAASTSAPAPTPAPVAKVINSNLRAPQDFTEECAPISREKQMQCGSPLCEATNKVVETLYQICLQSNADSFNLGRPGPKSEKGLDSTSGFLQALTQLEVLAARPNANFQSLQSDWQELRKQWEEKKIKNTSTLNQFTTNANLSSNNSANVYLRRLTQDLLVDSEKVDKKAKKLDFMFTSPEASKKYNEIYKKFIPDLMLDKPEYNVKFKGQTFTKEECAFLDMNFRKETLEGIQRKFQYTCAQ